MKAPPDAKITLFGFILHQKSAINVALINVRFNTQNQQLQFTQEKYKKREEHKL